jgi:hypothetical protein
MGKMIGGPLDGHSSEKTMVTLQCRYNTVPLQQSSRLPLAVYERVPKTDDFKWIATFTDEEEMRLWFIAHPNEWSYK